VPWSLIAPLLALVVAAATAAWAAVAVERQLGALRAEVATVARLRTAHDLLRLEIERAERRRSELGRPPEGWPPGPAR
jgi:hypothetical protein